MSKVLTSPVEEYAGTVTIPDRLTAPQYMIYKKTSREVQAAGDDYDELAITALPGVLALVEEWNISGLESPAFETFPMTPIVPAVRFLLFIWGEINHLVVPVTEAPNEQSPQP